MYINCLCNSFNYVQTVRREWNHPEHREGDMCLLTAAKDELVSSTCADGEKYKADSNQFVPAPGHRLTPGIRRDDTKVFL